MRLRRLELSDAPFMLEWMHDSDVVEHMKADFASKTIRDCQAFICSAKEDQKNLHQAITDDEDQYMGTVSLKNIHEKDGFAELGITVRRCAMGKGYAQFGMQAMLEKGFENLGLRSVIWCVARDNLRANRFYQKLGYEMTTNIPKALQEAYEDWTKLNWYEACNTNNNQKQKKKRIVILGGGGHARSVIDSIIGGEEFELAGYTDRDVNCQSAYRGCKNLGTEEALQEIFDSGVKYAFICVGYMGKGTIRNHLYARLKEIGYQLPAIADKTAVVAGDAVIGEGTFIGKGAVVNANASVGKMCIVNTSAVIEHDCIIGDFTHVSVGSVICGESVIGEGSMIGAGAVMIQGTTIGNRCMIGAGAVVVCTVEDQKKVIGNPGRVSDWNP